MRIEYKYYVNNFIVPQLLCDLKVFCRPDKHSLGQNRGYHVASVYFDDQNMTSYHQKMQGVMHRTKTRYRYYPSQGPDRGSPKMGFMELKFKVGDRVDKARCNLPAETLEKFLESVEGSEHDVAKYVRGVARYAWQKPRLRIDYDRIALFSVADSTVRVTVDTNVACTRQWDSKERAHVPVFPDSIAVIEIKSPGHVPMPLFMILKKYNLKRVAISKYGNAVLALSVNSTFAF